MVNELFIVYKCLISHIMSQNTQDSISNIQYEYLKPITYRPLHLHNAVHGKAFTHLNFHLHSFSLLHPHFNNSRHHFDAGISVDHKGCHGDCGSASLVHPKSDGDGKKGDGFRVWPRQYLA